MWNVFTDVKCVIITKMMLSILGLLLKQMILLVDDGIWEHDLLNCTLTRIFFHIVYNTNLNVRGQRVYDWCVFLANLFVQMNACICCIRMLFFLHYLSGFFLLMWANDMFGYGVWAKSCWKMFDRIIRIYRFFLFSFSSFGGRSHLLELPICDP